MSTTSGSGEDIPGANLKTVPTDETSRHAIRHALVLMARLSRALTTVAPPAVGEVGRSNLGARILMVLGARGEAVPSEIASELTADRSQISRALRQLERAQLIHRRIAPTDRRFVAVSLSTKGRSAWGDYLVAITDVLRQNVTIAQDWAQYVAEPEAVDAEARSWSVEQVIDRLLSLGDVTISRFQVVEAVFSISGWAERFALWEIDHARSTTAEAIASALLAGRGEVNAALSRLSTAGLIDEFPSHEQPSIHPAVELTPRGREIVAAHHDIIEAQLIEYTALFSGIPRALEGFAPTSPAEGPFAPSSPRA